MAQIEHRPAPAARGGRRRHGPARAAVAGLFALALLLVIAAPALAARKVEQIVSPGGISAWLVEERSIPLVAVRFSFAGGSQQDPQDRDGLAAMMASLLTEGAGQLDSEDFARRMAEEGAQISISAARDQIHGGLDALSRRLEASVELLRLALAEPRFEAAAVERVRQQQLTDLELADSDPRQTAFDRWFAEAFPRHPYGRAVNGRATSVRAITVDDIRAQHRKLMARSNLKVVIVGNIDRAAATTLLDRVFGALPARAGLTETGGATIARVAQPVAVPKDIPLATAAFGAASVASLHRDFPTLLVLNHIIGSGDFDATLMEEIRVKRGLAYSVSVSLINDASASIMLGGMATKTENMREALKLLEAVLRRTATEGPRPEQVENAKLYLTGSYLLDFDTNAKLAASLLRLWLAGREPSYLSLRNEDVRRVTVDDVRRLARELLAPDRFNIVVVGPKSLRD